MASLVFVHGIAVRVPTDGSEHPYEATCRALRYELLFKQINWTLVKCQWGDDLGARLLGDGTCFPGVTGRLGVALQPDDPAGLWALLLDDPTLELRALATMQEEAPLGPPGSRPRWLELQEKLNSGVPPTEKLDQHLRALDLREIYPLAVTEVQTDPAVGAAIRNPQASRAIARSLVARITRIALERGIPSPGLEDLESLVGEIDETLQEAQAAGISDWAKSTLLGWGTSYGERRRSSIAQIATPVAGDVILYQAYGQAIRQRISEIVASASEPVAVLAHSLGGVATVETLCENPDTRRRVRKFITAGSQSGFFYQINALRALPFGKSLPDDFPDWLNFWDSRDFLSFLVKPVFKGGRQRNDVQIESGLPFPASHSGYWRQAKTWEAMKTFLGTRT